MKNLLLHQSYVDDYNQFLSTHVNLSNVFGKQYLCTAEQQINTENYRILKYAYKHSAKANKIFFIIPSIFNSPEILFVSKHNNFIENLRNIGEVYLLEWHEIQNSNYCLNDYALAATEAVFFLANTTQQSINLIGHCLGGNIALAAAIIKQQYINSLTLLTTPWDFSHLSYASLLHKQLNLDASVRNLPQIPRIYFQTMFFLLFPHIFNEKIEKYSKLRCNEKKIFFLTIEFWLNSGHQIPNATYAQIMTDMLQNNIFVTKQWVVNNFIINPSLFKKPVLQIVAKNDYLVPRSAVEPLYNSFNNSFLLALEGGHINYLINDNVNFFQQYNNWIRGIK